MKLEKLNQKQLRQMRDQIDQLIIIDPIEEFINIQNEIKDIEDECRAKVAALDEKEPKFIKEINYYICHHVDHIAIYGGEKKNETEKYDGVDLYLKTKTLKFTERFNRPSDEIISKIEEYFQSKIEE